MSKKGKKPVALTSEERVLLLEKEQLAKEEELKKQLQLVVQIMKDKMTREMKSSQFNWNQLGIKWRMLLRDAKTNELKEDIDVLRRTLERVIDRKDCVTRLLREDLAEVGEQKAMSLRSHMQMVDHLMDIHKRTFDVLQSEFSADQTTLEDEFRVERDFLVEEHTQELDDLLDIMYGLEQFARDREKDDNVEFQSQRDDMLNRSKEEQHALRAQLEKSVEGLWAAFKKALAQFEANTNEQKKAFAQLTERDQRASLESATQQRKLQRLMDKIEQMKSRMTNNAGEYEQKNRELKEENEINIGHLQELKGQMNQRREKERIRLKTLTVQSVTATKELQRKLEKGERVLRLAETCRKLETEEEKVVPFYACTLTQEEQEWTEGAALMLSQEPLANVMDEYAGLENFWKRYNRVLLDKTALDKEKTLLQQENEQLVGLMKQYCDDCGDKSHMNLLGDKVRNRVLQATPLSLIDLRRAGSGSRLNTLDPRVKRSSVNVIEAAHAPKHRM